MSVMSECKHEWYLKNGRGYVFCGVCGKSVPVENLFERLQAENAELKRQNAELQVQCAAQAKALKEILRYGKALGTPTIVLTVCKALSTTAGADMLQRVRDLEQAARDAEELLRYQCDTCNDYLSSGNVCMSSNKCDVLPIANIIAALVKDGAGE